MEYVYAAMLLHTAGKTIDESGLTAVLKAAGVTADSARIKALTAALDGVNINEVIASAAVTAVAAAPAAASGGGGAAAKESKKDEEPGVSEEEAAAGLGALFG